MQDQRNQYSPNHSNLLPDKNPTSKHSNPLKNRQTITELRSIRGPQKSNASNYSSIAIKNQRNRFSIVQKPEKLWQNSNDMMSIEQPKQKVFAREYKSNLLKTIYRQTKLDIKKKSLKQSSTKSGIQYFYNIKEIHPTARRKSHRKDQTIYRQSFIKTSSLRKHEFQGPSITQLPLISQKNQIKELIQQKAKNFSPNPKDQMEGRPRRLSNNNAGKNMRNQGFQKQEINPWQTYHDQFIEE